MLISRPSFSAFFVVIRIAPSLPLEPYNAEAVVPFKTLIFAMLSPETSKKSVSTGIPSITIKGFLPLKEKEGG
ncbi:hypothetical protein D3C86_1682300 [compost metagenome]